MRISDWSSDVCASDLRLHLSGGDAGVAGMGRGVAAGALSCHLSGAGGVGGVRGTDIRRPREGRQGGPCLRRSDMVLHPRLRRSEEHTSELQSLMRISYAVFCLKKKTNK